MRYALLLCHDESLVVATEADRTFELRIGDER